MNKLHIAFAGTPGLAATVLQTLIGRSSHPIEAVYTQPDRPAGRGRKLAQSPVKQLAEQYKLPLFQPEIATNLKLPEVDVLVVVAYGMILPAALLSQPRYGCINIHTSLLPRWRGAAPIQRAIQAGDEETGVTIMQIDPGLDTGPILMQKKCAITANETAGSLHEKLAALGAECLLEALDEIATHELTPKPQDDALATIAKKINKAEAELDWLRSALELERTIRAFNPAPVTHTELNGIKLRIWQAEVSEQTTHAKPGSVLCCNKTGIEVATVDGILRLLKIQPPGKRVQTVAEFLNGRPDFIRAC